MKSSRIITDKFDLRTFEILAAVDEPLYDADDDDDEEGDDAVVWIVSGLREVEEGGRDLLMLLPETGRAGGKRKRTVVTIT